METVLIYGGTFNPPHLEHENILKNAILELKASKVLIFPTNIPPHKSVSLEKSNRFRFEMTKLAFKSIENAKVSDYEIQKGGVSYTYQTLEYVKTLYPHSDLYFIVGTDMLYDFCNWKNPKRILELASLYYVKRSNDRITDSQAIEKYYSKFSKKLVISNYVGKDLSSTKIRVYRSLGLDISEFVNPSVEKYLLENNIYCGDEFYSYIRKVLPEKRRIHTAGVILTALRYAKELNIDSKKAELSALLHDVAKYTLPSEVEGFTCGEDVPKAVIHQFCGAYIAENVLKVKDEEIINAIKYHSTGRPNMTSLEKLIYLADMIEPSRTFKGVENLRKITDGNFEKGFFESLKENVSFLGDGEDVYYLSRETLKYYEDKQGD